MRRIPRRPSPTHPGTEVRDALADFRAAARRLGSVGDRARRLQRALAGTETLAGLPLARALDLNLKTLQALFAPGDDLMVRTFRVSGGRRAAVAFLEGMVDESRLDAAVLRPLLYEAFPVRGDGTAADTVALLCDHVLVAAEVGRVSGVGPAANALLAEQALVLVDGEDAALSADVSGAEHRAPQEPETERVVRGPREGFVEDLRVNRALLRRRLRSPYLKLEQLTVGRVSRSRVCIAYVRGIAADALVREVRRRIGRVQIDGVLESAYLEEMIEDEPRSPFPQVKNSERPDVVAAELLEGRVGILLDGTPFVLVVPTTLWSLLQASEDYYERFWIASALRVLRYVFLFIALLLPSIYVAVTTFHQEMLPTPLLFTIASAREGIPFPALVEALILEISFEALREAGIRIPRPIGPAINIVGLLVIGQAAIQAGIVSPPMVIVVALTGIASFTVPRFNLAIALRILRFIAILLAGTLGLYGVVLGLVALLVHLAGLRSFGAPYLSPVAPLWTRGLTDVPVRAPLWLRRYRPRRRGRPDPRRQPPRQGPHPPGRPPAGGGSRNGESGP